MITAHDEQYCWILRMEGFWGTGAIFKILEENVLLPYLEIGFSTTCSATESPYSEMHCPTTLQGGHVVKNKLLSHSAPRVIQAWSWLLDSFRIGQRFSAHLMSPRVRLQRPPQVPGLQAGTGAIKERHGRGRGRKWEKWKEMGERLRKYVWLSAFSQLGNNLV